MAGRSRSENRALPQLRPFRPSDSNVVIQRHGELYALEYGWNDEFERHVSRIVSDFVRSADGARARAWIAEVSGRFAGCVFVTDQGAGCAQLRLLLVEPGTRRRGVGTRLVGRCIDFARAAGYERLSLWTNSVLAPARRLYARFGFRKVSEEAHHSYGQDLVGETWMLKL